MLDGVVPFPPAFAALYRDEGYWQDKSLADEFAAAFRRFAGRLALIEGDRRYTYGDVDALSSNLALNLLELGLQPPIGSGSRCPTGGIRAAYVPCRRWRDRCGVVAHRIGSQPFRAASARQTRLSDAHGDFRFGPMIERVQKQSACVSFGWCSEAGANDIRCAR